MGLVDIATLVRHSPEIMEIRKEQGAKNAELQTWADAISAEIDNITEKDAKAEAIKVNQAEFNKRKQDIATDHQQKLLQIDIKMTKVIEKVAKAKECDYVFAKGSILFGAEDITADVLKEVLEVKE